MRIPYMPIKVQTLAVATASAASAAVGDNVTVVRLLADTNCFVKFGLGGTSVNTPTASTSTGFYLLAGLPEYFRIEQGAKIAAIRATADGNLFITEMSL